MTMNKDALIQSTLISSAVTTIFVVCITIASELYTVSVNGVVTNPINDLLKRLHGHHWLGKSYWAVGLFVISTVIFYLMERKNGPTVRLHGYISALSGLLIGATVLIYGFFIYEAFL